MIRLLHLADIHLGAAHSGFEPMAEARREEVADAFRRLPEVAEEAGAHAVLLCGDLFDSPRPAEPWLALVREVARRLREANRPVFAIPGNHDPISLNPSLYADALPGAQIFLEPGFGSPRRVETAGGVLNVYGIAHDRSRDPDPLASFRKAETPGVHVVLLHGAVPDAPHWSEPSSLSLPLDRLEALDVDYVALGDYHRFRPPAAFGSAGRACYSGSFAAVDIGEDGPRGYAVAEVVEGALPSVRHLSSGVREVVRLGDVDVGGAPDELAVAELLRSRIPAECVPVVRLVGEPAFPLDAEKLRLDLQERYGCVRLEDATRFYASARLSEIARERTVAGHVARLGLRRVEEAEEPDERLDAERALRIALRTLDIA